MTIIVGLVHKKQVYMACDSQASTGWDSRLRKDPKIFISHNILYGFTSSYRMGQILQYFTEPLDIPRKSDTMQFLVRKMVPQWRRILLDHGYTKTSEGREEAGTFLVGLNGRLFTIDSDFQVGEALDPYTACGCGINYALGAMDILNEQDLNPESRVISAVNTAIKFSNGCGGEVLCLSL